jgi:hypothetical protein
MLHHSCNKRSVNPQPLLNHKFGVGAKVLIKSGDGRATPTSAFTIVRLLPVTYEGPLYRLRSEIDGHKRVIPEVSMRLLQHARNEATPRRQ